MSAGFAVYHGEVAYVRADEMRVLLLALLLEDLRAYDVEPLVYWLKQAKMDERAFTGNIYSMIALGYAAPSIRGTEVCLRLTSQYERDSRRVYLDNADRYISCERRGEAFYFEFTHDADGRLVRIDRESVGVRTQ